MMTELKAAISDIVSVINSTATNLLKSANERKEALAKAEIELYRSYVEINDFVGAIEELSKIGLLSGTMLRANDNIKELLDDIQIFESKVEEFDGYCDKCGVEITCSEEALVSPDNELFCVECAKNIQTAEA